MDMASTTPSSKEGAAKSATQRRRPRGCGPLVPLLPWWWFSNGGAFPILGGCQGEEFSWLFLGTKKYMVFPQYIEVEMQSRTWDWCHLIQWILGSSTSFLGIPYIPRSQTNQPWVEFIIYCKSNSQSHRELLRDSSVQLSSQNLVFCSLPTKREPQLKILSFTFIKPFQKSGI
jgi:hypothetical protein